VRISLLFYVLFLILFYSSFLGLSCAAEQAFINGSCHPCVITFRPGLQYDYDFLQLHVSFTSSNYSLRLGLNDGKVPSALHSKTACCEKNDITAI
jgi:hypothetical protein